MCSHIPLKERTQIRKVMDTKTEEQYLYSLLPKPKEICSASRKFGDLITAEHKVFNGGSESRNNHLFAVVVQVLVTKWTENNLRKFTETVAEAKSYSYVQFIRIWRKSCEELSWNHRIATPHRSETSGIADWAVRWVKEGTSAVLLQSGSNEKWWSDSMECCCYLRNVQDLLADGKSQNERRCGDSFKGPTIPLDALVGYLPNSERQSKNSSIWKESITRNLSGICFDRWRNWEEDILSADIEELVIWMHQKIFPVDTIRKKSW